MFESISIRKCVLLLSFILFSVLFESLNGAEPLPTCQVTDFHWEYTECDNEGGRWKVQVPKPNTCTGGGPRPPERGLKCEFTCKAGEYLDVQNQKCNPCPPGTFSLGGGVRFEDWDKLPNGFVATTESFGDFYKSGTWFDDANQGESVKESKKNKTDDCSFAKWTPNGKVISSLPGHCTATLSYTVNLVKPGTITFEYQHEDENAMFKFELKNSKCESFDDNKISNPNKWPRPTKNHQWGQKTMDLKSGTTTISFVTLGLSSGGIRKPVRIKYIDITGIAFTQECTKCRAGTKSGKEGSKLCEECQENSFSEKGATTCTKCAGDEYAAPGSSQCLKRPPCTEKDYWEYHSDCKNNQYFRFMQRRKHNKKGLPKVKSLPMTKKMYRWSQPKICREDLPGAVQLPSSGTPEPCPPCSPGMQLGKGKCEFCPVNMFSNGMLACQKCPQNTAAEYGLTIQWWNNLPMKANLTTNCLALSDEGCSSRTGWVSSTNTITTAKGHSDDAFLLMSIRVSGFKGNKQSMGGLSVVVGQIAFVFELSCESHCTFFFMKQALDDEDTDDMDVVESWVGTTSKQKYTFNISDTEGAMFTWAFQKSEISDGVYTNNHKYVADFATIYSVNITNTLDGGASQCKSCPRGANKNKDGCIPCPVNHYLDKETEQCTLCPPGTVVRGQNAWGIESCMRCGQGLTPYIQEADGTTECVTSCQYNGTNGKVYDFTPLAHFTAVEGSRLFTSSGTQYFHHFNISLCGGKNFPKVSCFDNITDVTADDSMKKEKNKLHSKYSQGTVVSLICRSTIIPPKPGDMDIVVAAQPASIGDILVNITNRIEDNMVKALLDKSGFSDEGKDEGADVHFFYRSESPTQSCKNGRSTVITLRCDISAKGTGKIELPPKCADGTCDGCNFHFLWRSEKACPLCKDAVFKEVRGECVDGEQEIHYIGPKYCQNPKVNNRKCSVLPLWLELTIICICALAVFLLILIIACWKHNRKLEYKYMKLVNNSESRDGGEHELPAAETCALSEDDDEEHQFDAVQFKDNRSNKFFSKITNLGKKEGME